MANNDEHGAVAEARDSVPVVDRKEIDDKEITNIERVISPDMTKNFLDYEKVDAEVAKCRLRTSL